MSQGLKNCPYPKCDHSADLGDHRYCPDCKQTIWRCLASGCGSTNQIFATYCRVCGEPLTQGADCWTHHARNSMRDSYQGQCFVKAGERSGSVGLHREADFACADSIEAGILIAYGMVYVTTVSGRVVALNKEDLRLQGSWSARADLYRSTPVVQNHFLFLAGSRLLTMFRLRGGGEPVVVHELPAGWQFGHNSLAACDDYLAATCFHEDGTWKALAFKPGDRESFERWESEPFVDCQGFLMPLIVSSRNVLVLMTGAGGVYQFRPFTPLPLIACNARSSPDGFCPSIHPTARGDHAYVIAGNPPNASLVSIHLKAPSLTTNLIRSLNGTFPHGLTLAGEVTIISFADGFQALIGSQPIGAQDHPKSLLRDAPCALGPYVIFSSSRHGLLYPYRYSFHGVDRLEAYPAREESPSECPYISAVPGSSEVIAARRDGVVHRLALLDNG